MIIPANEVEAYQTKIIRITLAQAKNLPNIMSKIVPTMLVKHGVYRCTIGGQRTKYILQ